MHLARPPSYPILRFERFQTGPETLNLDNEADEMIRGDSTGDDGGKVVNPQTAARVLEAIYIYPIKSCAPQRASKVPLASCFSVSTGAAAREAIHEKWTTKDGQSLGRAGWPIGTSGLAYDREWAVVDHQNRALRLKQVHIIGTCGASLTCQEYRLRATFCFSPSAKAVTWGTFLLELSLNRESCSHVGAATTSEADHDTGIAV